MFLYKHESLSHKKLLSRETIYLMEYYICVGLCKNNVLCKKLVCVWKPKSLSREKKLHPYLNSDQKGKRKRVQDLLLNF